MTHTPGPWNSANRGDFCLVTGTRAEDPEPEGRTIAEIRNTDTEAEDDARLIAAAPDLLEALEAIAHKPLTDDPEASLETCLLEIERIASTAIAKAKGT